MKLRLMSLVAITIIGWTYAQANAQYSSGYASQWASGMAPMYQTAPVVDAPSPAVNSTPAAYGGTYYSNSGMANSDPTTSGCDANCGAASCCAPGCGQEFGLGCGRGTGLQSCGCDSTGCDATGCDAKGCVSSACGLGACSGRGCGLAGCCGDRCCGRYLSFFGGWLRTDGFDGTTTLPLAGAPPIVTDNNVEFNEGWLIGLALGRQFRSRLRGEIEYAYRNNTADGFSATQTQAGNVIGQLNSDLSGVLDCHSGMANLIVDLRRFSNSRLTPYIGGGLGFAIANGNFLSPMGTPFSIDGEALAYQGFAGISFCTGQRGEIFSEYRYFGTDVLNFAGGPPPGFTGPFHYDSSNFLIGFRVRR